MAKGISHFYEFGPFRLDATEGVLRSGEDVLQLPPKVFETLLVLVRNSGHIVGKDELMKEVWPDSFVEEGGLARNISVLRKALEGTSNGAEYIETVSKRGYRFMVPVKNINVEATAAAVPQNGTLLREGGQPAPVEWGSPPLPTAAGSPLRKRWTLALGAGGLVPLAAVGWTNLGGLRSRLLGRAAPIPIHSVAVLPLENLTGDPSQDYFADGMTDELITNLAQIGALRVISRTSVMRFKDAKKTLPEIARQLNVEAVVEGAVTRSGDRVRITAQLIRADTDQHLWAEQYERDLRDVLALQDEVARDIAREVKVKLTPEERALFTTARPVNPEAHEAYLKGRYYASQMSAEGSDEKALKYFERAVEIDPSYAEAFAGIADYYFTAGGFALLPPREAFPRGKGAVARALALDDTVVDAHIALGGALLLYDWDWLAAEREFKRSLQLSPGNAIGHQMYGLDLMAMERKVEAVEQAKIAQSLDPLSQAVSLSVGYLLYNAHEYDQAVMQLRKMLELYPDFQDAHDALAEALRQKGLYREAMEEYMQSKQLSGRSREEIATFRRAYEKSEIKGYCREQLKVEKAGRERRTLNPYAIALWSACLDDKDQAFEWLEKAYQERSSALVMLKVDPRLDGLHFDPRFADLVRRIGLPP